MKKKTIFLIIGLIIIVIAVGGWLFVPDWRNAPGGLLALIGVVAVGVFTVVQGLISMLRDLDEMEKQGFSLPKLKIRGKGKYRPLQVFLCHAKEDKAAVRDLYKRLKADGFDVWFDEESLLSGQRWEVEIPRAVLNTDAVIVFLSCNSVKKNSYIREEIRSALNTAEKKKQEEIYLIPLKLEECDVPFELRKWQWVDFYKEGSYDRLKMALQIRATSLGNFDIPMMSKQLMGPQRVERKSNKIVLEALTNAVLAILDAVLPSRTLQPASHPSPLTERQQKVVGPQGTPSAIPREDKNFRISIAHPKLLSKRFSSLFLVHIYSPEMRRKVSQKVRQQFSKVDTTEHIDSSEVRVGQRVKIKLYSQDISFSEPVVKELYGEINAINFIGKPNDSCQPGLHQVILYITDDITNVEYQSVYFQVQVTDFAFDHISRPLLTKMMSITLGIGSLAMFILTLLGKIDTTFGLASGTIAGTFASAIYGRFLSLYQNQKVTNFP
jgi:hypothetical protein